ncbi:MAG: BatA domain-containing protein [Bacteroidota bacterium]|nr:BatA domain-containing protein [Bacteroidota bacterium]
MIFLYPYFLWAVILTGIPVIIHFFNFRRFRTVYFSNVNMLEEVKNETQKQSKIKHLVILSLRILAFLSLIIAFAQPYIPLKKKNIAAGQKIVSIYIDNSFSMNNVGKNGTLLDEAKKKATQILSAYKNTDLFQLLTNDFEGKHQRLVSKNEFLKMLDEIKPSPSVKTVSEIIKRQSDIFSKSSSNNIAYIISDFQNSLCDFQKIKNDALYHAYIVKLNAETINNLYLDSCWFETPALHLNQHAKLIIRIKNTGKNPFENVPVKLLINSKQKAIASFNIDANSSTEVTLPYTISETGIQYGELQIIDNPIVFDDKLFFSYKINNNIPVLAINEDKDNIFLNALFSKDSTFSFTNVNAKNIEYSALNKYNTIIINGIRLISSGFSQELIKYINDGGSLVIFPGTNTDYDSYRQLLSQMNISYFSGIDTSKTKAEKINIQNNIFKNVFEKIDENLDLPLIFKHYKLTGKSLSNEDYLIKLQNGDNLLTEAKVGKGKVYISSVGLNTEFSNFPKHPVFVPAVYNIVLYSHGNNSRLYYTIGLDPDMEINNFDIGNDNVFHIKNIAGTSDFIPQNKINDSKIDVFFQNQIKEAGNYNLISDKTIVSGVSFNYDRKESELKFPEEDILKDYLSKYNLQNFSVIESSKQSLANIISSLEEGKKLWKLFIILALGFFLAETVLLRFWSNK